MSNTANPLVHNQRTLPFSPAEIYAAIAAPERLAAWWGPEGFTNTFEQFEFYENGQWQFTMHGPDGSNYPNTCYFLTLQQNQQVIIRHSCEPLFTLTIELKPIPSGTEIHWLQAFDNADLAEQLRPIVAPCNEQNLDRLTLHLSGKLN